MNPKYEERRLTASCAQPLARVKSRPSAHAHREEVEATDEAGAIVSPSSVCACATCPVRRRVKAGAAANCAPEGGTGSPSRWIA